MYFLSSNSGIGRVVEAEDLSVNRNVFAAEFSVCTGVASLYFCHNYIVPTEVMTN